MLRIAYAPIYYHPLPAGHRFPMLKYELIPQQLLREGIIGPENLFEPAPASEAVILLTHTKEYWEGLRSLSLDASHVRRIGFPLSHPLVLREQVLVQGSIDCALYAMKHGVSLNVAGGTHHAFAARGEGFCLLNDFAVAANYLLQQGLCQRILIVDLDVHQGNGTASIFADEPRVFTFSMHGRNNFPFHKERSDLDLELPDGITDEPYLELLTDALGTVIEKHRPDFVFYLSGVDILQTDKLGKLKLSKAGCRRRDEIVFRTCHGAGLPVAVAMGGGYSSEIKDIVNSHCNTFKAAAEIFFS